jgi:hypothetical protein
LLDGLSAIYAVIEPDTSGAAVLKWLTRSSIRPRARLVRLPPGTKDPSELHLADPDGFKAAFQRALDAAEPCPEPKVKADDTKSGRTLVLHEPEPWPQPVDGVELLDEIGRGIRRYVVLDDASAYAVAWFRDWPNPAALSLPMICGPDGADPAPLGRANPNVRACVRLVSPAPAASTCPRVVTLENGAEAELVSSNPRTAMQCWISRLLASASVSCCWVEIA